MSEMILEILQGYLPDSKPKYVSNSKEGEWSSPCPVCGGDDRFRIWPNQEGGNAAQKAGVLGTWWCRGCDNKGDVIQLLIFAGKLSFIDACKELRIENAGRLYQKRPLKLPKQERTWTPKENVTPQEKWSTQATKLVKKAQATISGQSAVLSYLASRGLPLEAVKKYGLGYLEGEDKTGKCLYRAKSAFGLEEKQMQNRESFKRDVLWIPRGITIPQWYPSWNEQHTIHRVRIRRRNTDLKETDSKYMMLKGSAQSPLVLHPDFENLSMTAWVVVESELDAYAIHYACDAKVGVIAIMTNMAKPDANLHTILRNSPCILVALDFDTPDNQGRRAGHQGWLWWKNIYTTAKRWPVPEGKDPGEAQMFGYSLAEWVDLGLPKSLSFLNSKSMGTSKTGETSKGEREVESTSSVQNLGEKSFIQDVKKVSLTSTPKSLHWKPHSSDSSNEIILPPSCPYSFDYLISSYAQESQEDDLFIICPKTKIPWGWMRYEECRKCNGHNDCLLDFLIAKKIILATPTEEKAHNA